MGMEFVAYFMAIAKYRNLSKAMDYLFVSQSALNQSLAREEQELGVKLISRDRNELTLIHTGESYGETCRNMMELQSSLYKKLSGIKQSKIRHISIGITPQWGGGMFMEIYPIFKQRCPNYLVNLLGDTMKPLLEQMVKGTLDTTTLAVADNAPVSFPSVSVSRGELVFAVPVSLGKMPDCQRWPGTALKALNISKIENGSFIMSCSKTATWDIANSVSEQYRVSSQIIYEINNHSSSLKMVASGLGITMILLSYVDSNPHISYSSIGDGVFWNICTVAKRNFKPCEPDHYLMGLVGEYFAKEWMENRGYKKRSRIRLREIDPPVRPNSVFSLSIDVPREHPDGHRSCLGSNRSTLNIRNNPLLLFYPVSYPS